MSAVSEAPSVPAPSVPAEPIAWRGALPGAVAGIAGGLVFGAAMISLGTLPTVASIIRADSAYVGFAVHMMIATLVGAGFGMFVAHQRAQSSELLFWGLAYGAFWWFLGPQTLLPLFLGRPVAWDLASAQTLLPSLLGHLFYGMTAALVYAMLCRSPAQTPGPLMLVRGALAGVIAGGVLLGAFGVMKGASLPWLPVAAVALGLLYPVLFTGRSEGTGPALIRGAAYGFLWWIVAGLTLPQVVGEGTLDWSQPAAQEAASLLPVFLLLGAGTAAVFTWLGAAARALFVDDVRLLHDEAPGARGLRATFHGVLAGLAGGLVFTGVMLAIDALPGVARLVGADAAVVGFLVHMVIAQIVGVSYALLFRRRSFDLASGLGWGICYGFVWWVLGALTLAPVLLGIDLRWSATAMADAFPSLVGHLGYGAALGTVYYWLEARTNPWWATRNQVEARRVAARQEQTLGSASALWVLIALIALIIPLLVTP